MFSPVCRKMRRNKALSRQDLALVDERVKRPKNGQNIADLVAQSPDAFFTRGGVHLGPGLPGWRSISGYDRAQIWGAEEKLQI